MNTVIASIKRHPLVTFVGLTFVLSWWAWPLYTAGSLPVPIFAAGPFVAALIVIGLTDGRAAVGDLFRRMARWRVGLRWYAAALAVPVALTATAAALTIARGGSLQWPTAGVDWIGLMLPFAVNLLIPGFGGAWEEPGWRGYLLPQLQARRSALAASLIIALIGIAWHLPLFLVGEIQWPDVISMVGGYIVYAWMYNRSGGSILLLMIAHAANNTISGGLVSQMFAGADKLQQGWSLAVVWMVAAAVVVLLTGPNLGRRPAARPQTIASSVTAG